MSNFELYDYQKEIETEAVDILAKNGYVYLALEERTGKSLISMSVADTIGYDDVLFVTKKKAIGSIESDYELGKFSFNITVINYESLSKVSSCEYDLIIIDEAHTVSAFPKRGKNAKLLRSISFSNESDIIFLSATPAVESESQWFHQLTMFHNHSWNKYKNFYAWFRKYGIPRQKYIRGISINDYTHTINVFKEIEDCVVSLKREEAGFEHHTAEVRLVECIAPKELEKLSEDLKRNKAIECMDDIIIADSGASMVSKLHQLSGGTIIGEESRHILYGYKMNKALELSLDKKKVAIYYKYEAEKELLTRAINKNWTDDLYSYKYSDTKYYIAQIDSASLGVDLSMCDCHIIYSLTWSGATYIQAVNRMMNAKRDKPVEVDILIGLEIDKKVYDCVAKKKNFNAKVFERI